MRTPIPGVRSALTPGAFLLRGLLVGLVAGLLAFAVGYLVGEPHVERAIELEESASTSGHADDQAHDQAAGHTHGDDSDAGVVVTRSTQRTWGLLTGTVAIGVALGGLVALASAAAIGRLGRLTPRQSTAVVSLVGFVAIALVPFLKYPATPPAVGSGDTIGTRTATYFAFLAISLLAAALAVHLAARLESKDGGYVATLAGAATYLLVMVVAGLLMPTVNELGDFPADTLWSFRMGALATLAAMWAALGIGLTGLVGRLHDRATREAERRAFAASL